LSLTLGGARKRIVVYQKGCRSSCILACTAFEAVLRPCAPPIDGRKESGRRWVTRQRSMKPKIRNAHLLITHALDSCAKLLAVLHISSAQGRSVPHLCRVFIERGLPTTACRGIQIIPSQSSHQSKILMHLHLIKTLRALMDPISVSFPVRPCPDGAAPMSRHNKIVCERRSPEGQNRAGRASDSSLEEVRLIYITLRLKDCRSSLCDQIPEKIFILT